MKTCSNWFASRSANGAFDWKLVARFKARFYRKEALVLLRRKSD